MITRDEYLRAKAIVDEYEREEYESGMREAEEELNEFDDIDDNTCDCCGCEDGHYRGCPEDNSPYALLCREGYD